MKDDYFGHSQTNKFLHSFKVDTRKNPPPGLYPERLRGKPKRRLRAFRLPDIYVFDSVRGYQLNEDTFKIYRIRPGLIPVDAALVQMTFDHTKRETYICVEHPSFEEYIPGTLLKEIPIQLEEIEVTRQKPEMESVRFYDPRGIELDQVVQVPKTFFRGYGQPANHGSPQDVASNAQKLLARARAKGIRI